MSYIVTWRGIENARSRSLPRCRTEQPGRVGNSIYNPASYSVFICTIKYPPWQPVRSTMSQTFFFQAFIVHTSLTSAPIHST